MVKVMESFTVQGEEVKPDRSNELVLDGNYKFEPLEDGRVRVKRKLMPASMPPEIDVEVLCYIPGIEGHMPGKDWQDSNYCIGFYIGNGSWKRVDNENIKVSAWDYLPEE